MVDSPQPARTTIADVARRAGVSKGLVSFALNDRPGVGAQTRVRILAAAEELGWVPSVRARSLSVDRSFALGLVVARDLDVIAADPFFHAFIAGVERELAHSGQALVLAAASPGRSEEESYRVLARDRRVDGVFVTDLRAGDERIALLDELGLAAVTLGHPDVPSRFPSVSMDDASGIQRVVDHLIGLGHERIAHVAGPSDMLHALRRRAAFIDTVESSGLAPGRIVETDFSPRQGADATRHLLVGGEPPTAIVYANDQMALAGLAVAQRNGIRVPDDLSLSGFDNTDLAEQVYPSLTSVATDVPSWGAAAARALLATIDGDTPGDTDLPPPRLVTRESTAPAPAGGSQPGGAAAQTERN